MLPVHGAFKPHGRSGKEPTEILEPEMKTKHLSIILDADQLDFCPASWRDLVQSSVIGGRRE